MGGVKWSAWVGDGVGRSVLAIFSSDSMEYSDDLFDMGVVGEVGVLGLVGDGRSEGGVFSVMTRVWSSFLTDDGVRVGGAGRV